MTISHPYFKSDTTQKPRYFRIITMNVLDKHYP